MFANQTGKECEIAFLDCRGYYDLSAQIIGFVCTAVILYRASVNYRELKLEAYRLEDSEYEQSLARKVRVNLLNVIYLIVFLLHLFFSMVLFQIAYEQTPEQMAENKLEKLYKSTEILVIQLQNIMLLAVGLLYWNGLHFFFWVKSLPPPLPFSQAARYLLLAIGLYCILAFLMGIVLIFQFVDDDLFLENLLILLSTALSVTVFIFFRIAYYRNIFRSVRLGSATINRERIYNMAVIFSSIARISLCILGMNGIDLNSLRTYDDDCQDTLPLHAVLLLLITLGVDLLPSFIFSRIFTSFERQRHLHMHQNNLEQTLFSVIPSSMSGCSRESRE